MKAIRDAQGFSMIELLVSMLLLSLGLLGVAMLQTTTLKYSHSSYLRSIAHMQTNAMIDRMRANTAGVDAGHYDSISGTPSNPSCSTCTPAQMAQRDAFDWNSDNANFLPNGQGRISTNGNVRTITIFWDNERTGATGTACSGDTSVDLTCAMTEVRL